MFQTLLYFTTIKKVIFIINFRAQNLFGISDWSQSDHIDLENVFKNQPVSLSQFGPIIGGTLAGLLLICVLMFLFALNIIKTSQEKKPILLGSTTGRVCKKPRKLRNPTELFEGFQILRVSGEFPTINKIFLFLPNCR